MTQLTVVRLDSLGTVVTGSTPPAAHPEWFAENGVPFITPSDIVNGNRSVCTKRFLSETGVEAMQKRLVPPDTICFVSIGSTIGKMCSTTTQSVTNQQINSLVVNPDLANPTYTYYALNQQSEQLRAIAGGSATPILNKTTFATVELEVLPIDEQRAVGATLDALDEKIEANWRIVAIANELVNAEFMSMFGGRELELPLGEIANVTDCLHSKKPVRVDSGPTLMQLDNIRNDGLVDITKTYPIASDDYMKWSAKFSTQPWDHVITNVGRIGAVARIPEGFTAALGRNMTGVRPNNPDESGSFLTAALLSAPVRREIELRTDAGTIMNALNVRSIPLLRLPSSTATERRAFHSTWSPMYRYMDVLIEENRRLDVLRNTLLPELLNGRVRVPGEDVSL